MNKLVHKRYKVNNGFISQTLSSKITIFDGDKSVLYTLNETASYIFSKLKTGKQIQEIIDSMGKRYGIKPEKAQKDVCDLLDDLTAKKIILIL